MENWNPPPSRHWWWVVMAGLLVAVGGVFIRITLDDRVEQRIADGTPVAAEVTRVGKLPWSTTRTRSGQRITVAYSWDGVARTADLTPAEAKTGYTTGDRITVLVDPRDPGRVATADGFASEDLMMRAPLLVAGWSFLLALTGAFRHVRWWWRNERGASSHVPSLALTWTNDADHRALPWLWQRQLEALSAAVPKAAGETGSLRLRLWLQLGRGGDPEISWYSRRRQQLMIVVPVEVPHDALDRDPRPALRAAIARALDAAATRGEDLSRVRAIARDLDNVSAEELLDHDEL
ncbi:DUF3592 domain-containing protein [Actinoplanes sp. NPDC051861]|uniref:DUF3592 domain-containing protein n=1 Tax=Actinoplanes sp. NPDC051861 TaxID=3155170 RepID=UPI00341DFE9C